MKAIKLNPIQVSEIFETCTDQSSAAVSLYKLVFPDWDKIKSISGHPKTNKNTALILFDLFINFDKKYHPNIMPGGLWMNNGFSSLESDHLKDYEVDISLCQCEYE